MAGDQQNDVPISQVSDLPITGSGQPSIASQDTASRARDFLRSIIRDEIAAATQNPPGQAPQQQQEDTQPESSTPAAVTGSSPSTISSELLLSYTYSTQAYTVHAQAAMHASPYIIHRYAYHAVSYRHHCLSVWQYVHACILHFNVQLSGRRASACLELQKKKKKKIGNGCVIMIWAVAAARIATCIWLCLLQLEFRGC
jgi:hypothetical protein